MTTITTTAPLYRYRATLTAPFAHGAGNAGNTRLLRTQDVVLPDGTAARVPFLSAGSIRHGLRDAPTPSTWTARSPRPASTCCGQAGRSPPPAPRSTWTCSAASTSYCLACR